MSYPRNAASPERIAIGAVVLIADGTVQTSGVSISVTPQGGASGAGGGTTSYEQGIVFYLPTQAETNYTSFIVTAYKAGCIPVAATVVTSASATAGYAGMDWGMVANKTATNALTGTTVATTQKVDVDTIKTQAVTCAAGVTVLASVGTAATSAAQTGDTYALASGANGFVATKADTAAILLDTAEIGAAGAGLTAVASAASLAIVAGYLDTEIAAIKAKTDNLPAAPAATGDCITAAGVRTAIGLATANLDTQFDALPTAVENQSGLATASALAAVAAYIDTEVAAIKVKTDNLPAAPAATGDCITAAGVRTALGMAAANLDTQIDALPTAAEIQSGLSTLDAAGVRTALGLASANLDTQLDALPTAAENQSGLATASALSTVAGYLDTEVSAIKAKTDSLTFTEAGKIDANLLSIGTDTVAAAAFKRAVLGNTVGTIGSGSTTTSLVTSSLTPAASVADQFKGRIVTFAQDTTTAALRGQATDITASTNAGVLTITALTTAAVSGDTFAIT